MADAGALEALVARLERVASLLEGRLETSPAFAKKPDVTSRSIPALELGKENAKVDIKDGAISPSVAAFDELLKTKLARVKAAAVKIGGSVLKATEVLESAFEAERNIVLAISQCKEPNSAGLQNLVKPLGEAIQKAHSLTEGKRTDAFNHQKVVAESLATLSWVVYTGKDCGLSLPGPHVDESWPSAEFYNNKVLVEYKTKDPNHVEWAKAVKDLYIPGLKDYVKKFHTTGPAWNEKGIDVSQFGGAATKARTAAPSAPPSAPRAPPPPPPPGPPPPPPPPPSGIASSSSGAAAHAPAASMSEVFKELSKGEAVTAAIGLRKVTDDMKTKNRADRTGAVPAITKAEKEAAVAPVKSVVKKPVFELQLGRKWVVENQVGNKELMIDDTNPRQSVYVFGCKDSVIHVKGKVNNITLDKCVKTALVFSDVVAACEVVNCTSVEVQCQGSAPTIAIDNTNGCQLYLSANSLHASITTAKSSEVNVMVPGATPEADLVEHALPEQFLNEFKDGQFITTPVSHSGG
ncbi:hypothetical protein Mapa_015802 [Marchantia paleacea]|nr:hypothetical protein Mapa_015802 [Marchantia paleacea]